MPEESGQTVWDLAIAASNQRHLTGTENSGRRETTLVFVGSKTSGKTTLIHRFLERDEAAKPTLAMEYTFGRKTNQNLLKDVCHIWELGGGTMYTNLLETPLAPSSLPSTTVVILVDLSQPTRIWYTLNTLIISLKEYISAALRTEQATNLNIAERMAKARQERIDREHLDTDRIEPFPIPLLILGAKYDIFQDFEPEKKKLTCRVLRYVAHMNSASLLFYSAKDAGLVKRARDLLSHHAFFTDPAKGISQDYNKPLVIPVGSDSFQAIFGSSEMPRAEAIKLQFSTLFPQEEGEALSRSEDPARDPNFREPEVDMLRIQKDEELERYRRDVERRQKNWGDLDLE